MAKTIPIAGGLDFILAATGPGNVSFCADHQSLRWAVSDDGTVPTKATLKGHYEDKRGSAVNLDAGDKLYLFSPFGHNFSVTQ